MEELKNKRIAFHIHTNFSLDSNIPPEKIVEKLRGQVDIIIITDHDTIKGAKLAKEYARKYDDIELIVGEEISTEFGDIIGFPIQRSIRNDSYKETIKTLKKQKCIIVLPHPFKDHKLSNIPLDDIDIVESFNARTGLKLNQKAEELKHFSFEGSDAHILSEVENSIFKIDDDLNIITLKRRYARRSDIFRSKLIKAKKQKNITNMIKYCIFCLDFRKIK